MADETSTTLALVPPVGPNQYNPLCGEGFAVGSALAQSNDTDSTVFKAQADSTASSSVVGIAAGAGHEGRNCHTQFAGPLTLTTAQWDAITGASGGLTPGATYYLSAGTAGRITSTAPGGGGQFVTQVGIATSARTLLVQIGPQQAVSG